MKVVLRLITVDRFQGEEAEICLLYDPFKKEKKFFSDAARLNVALSRTQT